MPARPLRVPVIMSAGPPNIPVIFPAMVKPERVVRTGNLTGNPTTNCTEEKCPHQIISQTQHLYTPNHLVDVHTGAYDYILDEYTAFCDDYKVKIQTMTYEELERETKAAIQYWLQYKTIPYFREYLKWELLRLVRQKFDQEERTRQWVTHGGGGNEAWVEKRYLGPQNGEEGIQRANEIQDSEMIGMGEGGRDVDAESDIFEYAIQSLSDIDVESDNEVAPEGEVQAPEEQTKKKTGIEVVIPVKKSALSREAYKVCGPIKEKEDHTKKETSQVVIPVRRGQIWKKGYKVFRPMTG